MITIEWTATHVDQPARRPCRSTRRPDAPTPHGKGVGVTPTPRRPKTAAGPLNRHLDLDGAVPVLIRHFLVLYANRFR
jgi:hypothetical protein